VAVVGLFPLTGAKGQGYTQLTNVPTVYIETENGRSITSKEQYTKCTIIIVDGDSIATYPDTEIRGRGNSTWWNSDKKAYRIKFATKQKLLGRHFANARSWTLLANHGDKTMIRNALTYDLGRFMGMEFCPAARFVDVYLNGTYRGTYQISDQVQAHKRRIDINEEDGCILEVANENSREEPYITSSVFRIMYNVKNPKDDALTMQKRIAIGQWIEGMERAVKGNDFTDPEQGYRAYIDEQSLVNWYVGAEITGNIDALYSIYMWKDADEQKMHFGPLWDLDIGYDNSSERSMLREMEAYLGLWNRPFEQVLRRMWQDWWFANACADRLNELIANGLQQYLLDHIDSLSAAISQSQAQNYRIWPINQQVFSFEKHRYYNNYQAYINDLKDFVRVHIPYLQQAFEQRRTTGIHQMENGELKMENETIYDLSGRKVRSTRPYSNTPTILIRNHQKILKK
jgi:hypothetical protein